MKDLTWVPQSCTLPTTEQPFRVAEWDTLFSEHLVSVSRPETRRLHLDLTGGPDLERHVRDLADRESGCCSFFTFTTTQGDDLIGLDIEVDPAHVDVLDALADRSTARELL